jgi:ribonuclease-3
VLDGFNSCIEFICDKDTDCSRSRCSLKKTVFDCCLKIGRLESSRCGGSADIKLSMIYIKFGGYSMPNEATTEEFQRVIGYKFNNIKLLDTALTCKSCAFENNEDNYYERMEFLGDSVLSAVVAEFLYVNYPEADEGKLSKLKSHIVSTSNLSVWANEINLISFARIGKSRKLNKNKKSENLLCDLFEALIGAIFLDGGGFDKTKAFVLNFLNGIGEKVTITDYKSRLQEYSQSVYKELPVYKITREFGKDHDKKFESAVYVNGVLFGNGVGTSKKESEQIAAKRAAEKLNIF